MDERYSFSVIDGRDIYATSLKLVKEGLIVIGPHTGPASALHLGVENGY
jgi:hypothetical protein